MGSQTLSPAQMKSVAPTTILDTTEQERYEQSLMRGAETVMPMAQRMYGPSGLPLKNLDAAPKSFINKLGVQVVGNPECCDENDLFGYCWANFRDLKEGIGIYGVAIPVCSLMPGNPSLAAKYVDPRYLSADGKCKRGSQTLCFYALSSEQTLKAEENEKIRGYHADLTPGATTLSPETQKILQPTNVSFEVANETPIQDEV